MAANRTFTDDTGCRWKVDTDEAGEGRLVFTDAAAGPTLLRAPRFLVRSVLVAGTAFVLTAVIGHEESANDVLISVGLGVAAGLVQRWSRAQRESVVFAAPFACGRS